MVTDLARATKSRHSVEVRSAWYLTFWWPYSLTEMFIRTIVAEMGPSPAQRTYFWKANRRLLKLR